MVNSGGSAQHMKDMCSQNREAPLCVWYRGEAYMEAMSVHSQYTSTIRVKVADPATLLAVILYSPLSLRVRSAIVRLVVVTVTLGSVTGVPLLVSVMLSLEGSGLALMVKESVSCPPSVCVAVAVEGENSGGSVENSETI